MTTIDHPIFDESVRFIRSRLHCPELDKLEVQVLERLIHTTGDFGIQDYLTFSPNACQLGVAALQAGAPILTDTFMAAAAVNPMASRTMQSSVHCILDWAPKKGHSGLTRTALGIESAWTDLSKNFNNESSPIILFGSAPKALEVLLGLIANGALSPSLIIGMPVGFISVLESKMLLSQMDLPQIRIDGNRGGAAMAAATVNALLRASWNIKQTNKKLSAE
ncbi:MULTISPECIES: precorrin-8X methylmutase [Prochlorococcus]|uniref:Precorrin isomerase n=1 Tax=Prochlorococcus marinus (strain SARG / CCMP1375 / SS120) TaxID=167539 RepID=Q7V9M4_PROMA|nr:MULTISPECIES: precorrin-8X methylmutase [Prochlorococcus]AAQ00850.1 Precorrin isomerase [Prochlorococcus marinus subsp. marinus str. CCMP1375]